MSEYPYEALRAFCATKPTEFDAFLRKWNEEHPDPIATAHIITAQEMDDMWTEKEKNQTIEQNLKAINDALSPVEPEPEIVVKPKSKKKRTRKSPEVTESKPEPISEIVEAEPSDAGTSSNPDST